MKRMLEKIVSRLVQQAGMPRNRKVQLKALIIDEIFFLTVVPWMLLLPAWLLSHWFWTIGRKGWELPVGWAALSIGLGISLSAVRAQWTHGKGTPSLQAPTERLVTTGPYRYTRNPIQLGALSYVFGLGLLVFSWHVAVVALAAGSIIGVLYIRLIEERELSRRFGSEYEAYRKRTPFLIPGIRSFRKG